MNGAARLLHATAAAAFAVLAPLSLLTTARQADLAIGLAALAVVVSGALARVRPAAKALGVGLLVVYFLFGSATDTPGRTAASIALCAAAAAYAGYSARASVTNLSASGHRL